MTKEEILEGNKLIAEFMQAKNEISDVYYLPEFGHYFNSYGQIEWNECFRSNELKYHTSWDWLMPCIGKISNKCEEPEELDGLKYALLTNNIEEAWIFCIEFIKWYNEKCSE